MLSGERAERNARLVRSRSIPTLHHVPRKRFSSAEISSSKNQKPQTPVMLSEARRRAQRSFPRSRSIPTLHHVLRKRFSSAEISSPKNQKPQTPVMLSEVRRRAQRSFPRSRSIPTAPRPRPNLSHTSEHSAACEVSFVMLSGERAERNARLVRSRSIPTSLFHPGIPFGSQINPMRVAADDQGDFLGARPPLELFFAG